MSTREIDLRIAAALERVAANKNAWIPLADTLCKVAAELRAVEPAPSKPRHPESCRYMGDGDFQCSSSCPVDAWDAAQRAKPASEPQGRRCPKCSDPLIYGDRVGVCGRCSYVESAPAPPPSLVERLRCGCVCKPGTPRCLTCEASDALEAAQADSRRLDALERWARRDDRTHAGAIRLLISWPDTDSLRETADALAATMERKP